jgi:AcrR family transcriptional regulator
LPYHHGNLRQVLLEEAAEAIREDGVGRLSLRELARRAGVSHGAPARHFPDKAALLTALATDALERFREALLGGVAEAGESALERHRAIGMGYIRFAIEHPAYFRLMTHRRDFFEPDEEFDAAYRRLRETIREATIAAQQEGWGVGRDPDELLITAWSVVHGFATLYVAGDLHDHYGPIDPEAAASAVIDIVYGADTARGSAAKGVRTRRRARSGSGTQTRPGRKRRSNGS